MVDRYYRVSCDSCGLVSAFCAAVTGAENAAKAEGFRQDGDSWLCPSCHAPQRLDYLKSIARGLPATNEKREAH